MIVLIDKLIGFLQIQIIFKDVHPLKKIVLVLLRY